MHPRQLSCTRCADPPPPPHVSVQLWAGQHPGQDGGSLAGFLPAQVRAAPWHRRLPTPRLSIRPLTAHGECSLQTSQSYEGLFLLFFLGPHRKLRARSRSCGDALTEGWKMNCTLPSCREASIIPLFCDKSRFLTRCFHRLSLTPHGTIMFIHLCFIFAIKKKIIPALISAPFVFFECF